MTLENRGAREQFGASRGANYSASEEDIQLLIDGAEVVLAGRQAKALREKSGRLPQGIDPRSLGRGETDLDNDLSAAAFGEDQSDFQNVTSQDKDFGKSARNDNRVAYYDPDTEETKYYTFQEGQPTRRAGIPGEEGYQDSDSWQQRRAIRQAALNKGYGPEISERRSKPVDRTQPGLRTEVQSRVDAPTARDTGGGYKSTNDAARQLRSRIASGELTEDSVISIDNKVTGKVDVNVGQLLNRLEGNQAGRPAAMKDRAEGRKAVQQSAPSVTEAARASINDEKAKREASATEGRRSRIRATLDAQPDLVPGPKVYVNDSGIAEGDIPQGASGSSRNMKMVKLNDYQVANPSDPANWRASELSQANQIVLGGGREYYDGSGNLIGDWEPDQLGYQAEAQVDDPTGRAVQNVPSNPVSVQDLAAQEIKKRQSAERMRQVSIGGSLDVLMNRLQESPGGKAGAFGERQQPRSLGQLQELVDAVADEGRGAGRAFYGFDPASPGRSKRVTEPTARDILANTLKMSPDEIGNLTQALTMLDAGRDTSVPVNASPMARANHQFKEDYYEGGNAGATPGARPGANSVAGVIRTIPDAKPVYGVDPTADPALLGRNALHHIGTAGSKDRVTVGTDAKGNPVRMEVGPQLRGLTGAGLSDLAPSEASVILDMARSNQIGTFSGDEATPRVYQGPSERRNREDVILDSVRKYEGFGKSGDTAGIMRSANRDLENEAALSGTDAAMGRRQAELDARPKNKGNADDAVFFAAADRRAKSIDDVYSRGEAAAASGLPTQQNERTSRGAGRMVPGDTPRIAERVRPVQPTRPAATPSIAPTPGDITGNQSAPQIDSGRGGPMPTSMREELFSLDGPLQGPEASSRNFMGAPDTSQSTRSQRMEQAAGLRRKRTGRRIAAGVGGAAGILGALGLSNMGNEEERV